MKKGGSFLLEPVVHSIFTRERFSDEQREIDRMAREFARDKIQPQKEALAVLNKELTLQLMHEAGELGMTAIDIPEKYGGLELDKDFYIDFPKGYRSHQIRLEGGDCSTDSFCYPNV